MKNLKLLIIGLHKRHITMALLMVIGQKLELGRKAHTNHGILQMHQEIFVGAELDLARDLCKRMNAECEFVQQDWDGIIPALVNGKYDVIMAGMSVTEERKKQLVFLKLT